MRTKARDGFIKALRDAHRWLDELLYDPTQTIELLAVREGKSERSIRMTLSLAFICPVLAEAAMGGRLPRGFCVKRLTDLPMLWSEQWRALGLQAPFSCRPNPADRRYGYPLQSFLGAQFGEREASESPHRWLDELLFDPTQTIESLAVRESKSERSIRMTLSLAFVSPALAEVAMEGRLPRGFCVKRLTDLPMLWSEQWRAIGLQEPVQAQVEPS